LIKRPSIEFDQNPIAQTSSKTFDEEDFIVAIGNSTTSKIPIVTIYFAPYPMAYGAEGGGGTRGLRKFRGQKFPY
jgi:hypothetical protein